MEGPGDGLIVGTASMACAVLLFATARPWAGKLEARGNEYRNQLVVRSVRCRLLGAPSPGNPIEPPKYNRWSHWRELVYPHPSASYSMVVLAAG